MDTTGPTADGSLLPMSEADKLTLEAMADVDAGRVVDHAVVQAWADSLDSDMPSSVPPRLD